MRRFSDEAKAAARAATDARKRALRRLAREQGERYQEIYSEVRAEFDGTITRASIRGRAWTLLRQDFLDRYLELFIEERDAVPVGLPTWVRVKAWAAATALLVDRRPTEYKALLEENLAKGWNVARAYEAAATAVRAKHPDLFTELLADQIEIWSAADADTI